MRRIHHALALAVACAFPLYAPPAPAQDTPVQPPLAADARAAFDDLRVALEGTGFLVSVGGPALDGASVPQVRVFNATTSPLHIDLRLGGVVVERDGGGWLYRLPPQTTASVRWGVGARPWVFAVTTQDAVFGLGRGPGGSFDAASLKATSAAVASQPGSPGVLVALAQTVVLGNREAGAVVEQTWSWDRAEARLSMEQTGGGKVDVELRSQDVARTRRASQAGWLESVPWMEAVGRGMRVEETVEVGDLLFQSSTTVGDRVDRDRLSLRSGTLRFVHDRNGALATLTGSDARLDVDRPPLAWSVQTPTFVSDARLPTHPSPVGQTWSLRTQGVGSLSNPSVSFPLTWDVDLSGSAVLARPVFKRTASSWAWAPIWPALDGVDGTAGTLDLSIDGQALAAQGTASLAPSGALLDATLSGGADRWAAVLGQWGGAPFAAALLARPDVAAALSGPGPRLVTWGAGGLDVGPARSAP